MGSVCCLGRRLPGRRGPHPGDRQQTVRLGTRQPVLSFPAECVPHRPEIAPGQPVERVGGKREEALERRLPEGPAKHPGGADEDSAAHLPMGRDWVRAGATKGTPEGEQSNERNTKKCQKCKIKVQKCTLPRNSFQTSPRRTPFRWKSPWKVHRVRGNHSPCGVHVLRNQQTEGQTSSATSEQSCVLLCLFVLSNQFAPCEKGRSEPMLRTLFSHSLAGVWRGGCL